MTIQNAIKGIRVYDDFPSTSKDRLAAGDSVIVTPVSDKRVFTSYPDLSEKPISYGFKSIAGPSGRIWFARHPGKAWCEKFMLGYSACWILVLVDIVYQKRYEHFGPWEYMGVGSFCAFPYILGPLLFRGQGEETGVPYWIKANVWIGILSFVGNWFWTHYFYNLLGAKYLFDAHRINDVPISMFLMTHAYFCFYHTSTTILLRRLWHSTLYSRHSYVGKKAITCGTIAVMSYVTAFLETYTISSFPYWHFENRSLMYSVGSIFYSLVFLVTFTMFYRIDEEETWSLSRTAIDSLAASMIVTILFDLWRSIVGGIVANIPSCVPFL